jgi:hypothetical protein
VLRGLLLGIYTLRVSILPLASVPVAISLAITTLLIVFAFVAMGFSNGLVAIVVSFTPWFHVVVDVYFARAMRLGVSVLAMVPRGWNI